MTPLLQVEGISKRFTSKGEPVVRALSMTLEPGELLALLGPSGCGKTTTLRMIAGFERPDSGAISLGDRVFDDGKQYVPVEARHLGFVFQDYALFPHLDVLHNVTFGLGHLRRRERKTRALELLETLELSDVAQRMPYQLSGGQQQRVALARSIAPTPTLVLLDEPFSNLDARLRQASRLQVRELLKSFGMSAILVTHDQAEALESADRVGVMRDGRLEQLGTPEEIYERPRTAYVASFVGQTNLLPAEATGRQARTVFGPIELDRAAQGDIQVSLRPECLGLSASTDAEHNARIASRHYQGGRTLYRVRLDGSELLVELPGGGAFQPGDAVAVVPRGAAVVLE